MSIAALALDRYADSTSSVAVKENNIGVDETSKSFGAHLNEATEKKCPYSFLAKDGIPGLGWRAIIGGVGCFFLAYGSRRTFVGKSMRE